jgi:hypothetical protein
MNFKFLIALFSCVLSFTASAEHLQSEPEIVFFPLADMDSEINTSLKTVVEAGDTRPSLVIHGEDALPKELTDVLPVNKIGKSH